jgi:hypothetical protein
MGSCPSCNSKGEAHAIDGMGTFVCLNCGALVLWTPFRIELLLDDARKRFPELSTLPVTKWINANQHIKKET